MGGTLSRTQQRQARARINRADIEARAQARAASAEGRRVEDARRARGVNHHVARKLLRKRLREAGASEDYINRRAIRLARWQEISRYGRAGALERWVARHPRLPLGTIEVALDVIEDMCTVCQESGQHAAGCHRAHLPTRMEMIPL
jgi:hypothetical protein